MTSRRNPFEIARRRLLLGLVTLPIAQVGTAQSRQVVEVWKAPTCGCCKDWIAHMEANGFSVKAHDTGNNPVRLKLGMPASLGSCHTAVVGGYVIEGHVPAREIRRLLKDKPAALGLAVPGMPVGSPGMDSHAYGNRKDPYDVLLVRRDGATAVFQSYR